MTLFKKKGPIDRGSDRPIIEKGPIDRCPMDQISTLQMQ